MVGLRNGHIRKNRTRNGEPQRYGWGLKKKKKEKEKEKKKKKKKIDLNVFMNSCLLH